MSEIRFQSAGVLGAGLVGGLFLTTRIRRIGAEQVQPYRDAGRPVMWVFWHGHLLTLVHVFRHTGVCALVSEHDDGEYATRMLQRLGVSTVRGSSTRGGKRGLKGLVRAARAGHDLGVSPDGPKGPPRVFKPGALVAAQLAEIPVVPLVVRPGGAWNFNSWDQFMVPKPFSSIEVEYLTPRDVPRDASREHLEEMAAEIGAAMTEREKL